jgi:hypothetical protein
MTAIEAQDGFCSPTERPRSPEGLHEPVIRQQFEILRDTVNPITGLWPAVEVGVGKKEAYEEDHMQDAWIRDSSMNLIGLIEAAAILKHLDKESALATEIGEFVRDDIHRVIGFLNQPRWTNRFRQRITTDEDHSTYANPEMGAPEVHLKTDGNPCEWKRQNQPDSWGELLIAIGRARQVGIMKEYLDDPTKNPEESEVLFIKRVAGYLCRIQPWHFECSGMWEDPEVKAPRSTGLIIIKGLKAIRDIVKGDQIQADIHVALRRTMAFVREDPNTDRTSPDHGDGADLAMAIAEAMPSTERTRMPVGTYISDNAERLSIGFFPAAKRHLYDVYYGNPKVAIGEARWFISNPTLVIDYAQATRIAIEGEDFEKAAEYFYQVDFRFDQTMKVLSHYGYPWELAKPTDPDCVEPDDHPWPEIDPVENVVLVPLERSLLWNRAFIAWAAAEALFARKRVQHLFDIGYVFPPGFFHSFEQQDQEELAEEEREVIPKSRWRLLWTGRRNSQKL